LLCSSFIPEIPYLIITLYCVRPYLTSNSTSIETNTQAITLTGAINVLDQHTSHHTYWSYQCAGLLIFYRRRISVVYPPSCVRGALPQQQLSLTELR